MYRCRKCGYIMVVDQIPEVCPNCGRMFHDVFTTHGIVTYKIMEEIFSEDSPIKDMKTESENLTESFIKNIGTILANIQFRKQDSQT